MKRLSTIVCAGLLATAVLTGCGDDSGDGGDGGGSSASGGGDYCDQVKDFKGEFESLSSEDTTLDDMSSAVDRLGDIEGSAPDDIKSSWTSMHDTLDKLLGGFEDLGIDKSKPLQQEMTDLQKEDPQKLQEAMSSMSGLGDIESDSKAIEKNVKSECDFELNDSDSEGSGDSAE